MESGWLTGPVAITGANGQVGSALQKRLTELPNEVRALARGDDLRRAFKEADVVVHLAGTLAPRRPNTYRTANLETVIATVDALQGSAARRVVFLSYIDADSKSRNPYLRFKGEAEQLLRASGTPAVILRSTHIIGTPGEPGPTATAMLSKNARRVAILGAGTQRYAWISKSDVVEALTRAALDPGIPAETFELAGPDELTLDEFARHINGPGVRLRHIPGWLARALGRVTPSLPGPLVDVMLRDSLPTKGPRRTADLFGFRLHSLEDTWPCTDDEARM